MLLNTFLLVCSLQVRGNGCEHKAARPMEPFDLTFHEVISDDSLNESSNFDSFSNVVNYETYFDTPDRSLPLNAYNVNTVQYCWKGKAAVISDVEIPCSCRLQE